METSDKLYLKNTSLTKKNKMIITNLDKNDNTNLDLREGLFNSSIIPIGSLLSTKYFISLQLILGLIIVACVISSVAITKNTIENEEEGDKEDYMTLEII